MSPLVARRAGALVLAGALTGAVLSPTAASAAAPGGPPTGPSAAAGAWIAGQLGANGLLPGQFGPDFPDYGLTIDAALAIDAVGGPQAAVQQIAGAIEENVDSYIGYDYTFEGVRYYGDVAGATAKAAVLARTAGADETDFGGTDLVERLESLTIDDGATAGRIFDTAQGEPDYAYANTISQSFAARALTDAASPEAAAATDFLLAQQCSEGFFRLSFSDIDAADQTCDSDPDAAGDTDVTAFALLALVEQAGDPDVDTAIAATVGWLEGTQAADGSFGGGVATESANANSTGLAGWALGEAGADAAAADAAAWVAALQAPADTACLTGPLAAEAGAIAYDQAALTAGEADGISAELGDQWRRTTAQALPVLQHLEGVAAVNALRLVGPRGFQRARSSVDLTVRGLGAVGDGCVTGPGAKAAVTGAAPSASIKLPGGTGERTYTASWLGDPATTTVKVLGATKLAVDAKRGSGQGRSQAGRQGHGPGPGREGHGLPARPQGRHRARVALGSLHGPLRGARQAGPGEGQGRRSLRQPPGHRRLPRGAVTCGSPRPTSRG